MTKLQAAMRDKSAKTWRERIVMYKVGSPMKGCNHCGDIEEDDNGRFRYTSGFNVFRAYRPWETKWTWACTDCGSKDLACWANDSLGLVAAQLGKEPKILPHEEAASYRRELRKEAEGLLDRPRPRQADQRIAELEAELERLKIVLNGGKSWNQ